MRKEDLSTVGKVAAVLAIYLFAGFLGWCRWGWIGATGALLASAAFALGLAFLIFRKVTLQVVFATHMSTLFLLAFIAAVYLGWWLWGLGGAIGAFTVIALVGGIANFAMQGGLATHPMSWPSIAGAHPIVNSWNTLGSDLAAIPSTPAWRCIARKLVTIRVSTVFDYIASTDGFQIDAEGFAREANSDQSMPSISATRDDRDPEIVIVTLSRERSRPVSDVKDPATAIFFRAWNNHVRPLRRHLSWCGLSTQEVQQFIIALKKAWGRDLLVDTGMKMEFARDLVWRRFEENLPQSIMGKLST